MTIGEIGTLIGTGTKVMPHAIRIGMTEVITLSIEIIMNPLRQRNASITAAISTRMIVTAKSTNDNLQPSAKVPAKASAPAFS